MNPTQSLYRYSTLMDSINRMNSLATQMDLMSRSCFENAMCSIQFTNNISGTALASFKGVHIQALNTIPTGEWLKSLTFPHFPVLPNLDWILEEPEDIQEQPLDVITEYQIKTTLQQCNDRLSAFPEDFKQQLWLLEIDLKYGLTHTLTLKNVYIFFSCFKMFLPSILLFNSNLSKEECAVLELVYNLLIKSLKCFGENNQTIRN